MPKVRAKRVPHPNVYRNPVTNPVARTGTQLAYGALGDADQWWTDQGSAPPPLKLHLQAAPDGQHAGYGVYGTGDVNLDPAFINRVASIVNDPKVKRSGKAAALAGLWTLAAHETGHNIGYGHTPQGLMSEGPQQPAEAVQWAYRMVPSTKVRKWKGVR